MAKLTKKITFRFSEEDYNNYLQRVHESGFNSSEFFRNVILNNKAKVVPKEDSLHIIYHLNKMENNLNQQTHNLKKAYIQGKISEQLFKDNLKVLNEIKRYQDNIIDLILYTKA